MSYRSQPTGQNVVHETWPHPLLSRKNKKKNTPETQVPTVTSKQLCKSLPAHAGKCVYCGSVKSDGTVQRWRLLGSRTIGSRKRKRSTAHAR